MTDGLKSLLSSIASGLCGSLIWFEAVSSQWHLLPAVFAQGYFLGLGILFYIKAYK